MLQLSFNQKVGLGFAIIILLLLTSGLSSLWNLNDITGSSSLVNETAVPVVKQSNDVQIQLLKLAKLSSLAFNAGNQDQIDAYKKSFDTGTSNFDKRYLSLADLAESDAEMSNLVTHVKENYEDYRSAVNEMFTAKTEVLAARNRMLGEVDILFNLIDGVGAAIDEMQYYMAPEEYQDEMELVIGNANSSITSINNLFKTIEEIKITQDKGLVSGGMGNFTFSINDSKAWFDKAGIIFSEFDEQGLVPSANDACH